LMSEQGLMAVSDRWSKLVRAATRRRTSSEETQKDARSASEIVVGFAILTAGTSGVGQGTSVKIRSGCGILTRRQMPFGFGLPEVLICEFDAEAVQRD